MNTNRLVQAFYNTTVSRVSDLSDEPQLYKFTVRGDDLSHICASLETCADFLPEKETREESRRILQDICEQTMGEERE